MTCNLRATRDPDERRLKAGRASRIPRELLSVKRFNFQTRLRSFRYRCNFRAARSRLAVVGGVTRNRRCAPPRPVVTVAIKNMCRVSPDALRLLLRRRVATRVGNSPSPGERKRVRGVFAAPITSRESRDRAPRYETRSHKRVNCPLAAKYQVARRFSVLSCGQLTSRFEINPGLVGAIRTFVRPTCAHFSQANNMTFKRRYRGQDSRDANSWDLESVESRGRRLRCPTLLQALLARCTVLSYSHEISSLR